MKKRTIRLNCFSFISHRAFNVRSRLLSVLPHCLQDVGHLLPLPLGPDVGADPLLEELEAPLVLGDPEQLHRAALVGGEAGNFADKVADEPGRRFEMKWTCLEIKLMLNRLKLQYNNPKVQLPYVATTNQWFLMILI